MNRILVNKVNEITVFDGIDYTEKKDETIHVQLLESKTREINRILAM